MFIAWNPFGAIVEGIQSFFIGILLFLDAMIYTLINWVYQIILVLCNADILSNGFEIEKLVGRIYIIIGVIVLFLVAYTLLKSMVNPDEALKGKKSPVSVIKDVLISVALVALVPTIFQFAMGLQGALLNKNTLGILILGSSNTIGNKEENSGNTISEGGMTIASNVLYAFLHPNYSGNGCTEVERSTANLSGYDCSNVKVNTNAVNLGSDNSFDNFWNKMQESGSLLAITDLNKNIIDGDVTYYYLISTVAGVFVLFVLIAYCFDIAVRAVKLAVFELIAPLPILARIIPNEQGGKVFSNWLKATISTYVEVFIRLAILFFAVLIIKIVIQNFPSMFILFEGSAGFGIALFAQMFLVVGIILFVKQAPEIIKEITGLDGGKYGKSLMKGIGMMTATLGGGATAAIRTVVNDKDNSGFKKGFNAFKAGMSAGVRGMYQGYKTEKFGDMPKAAGKAVSNTLEHRAKVQAAGGNAKYLKQWMDDKRKDVDGWISGGFEAQQKMLEQINAVTQDADAVKSKTEGFIRDKKYLFNFGQDKDVGEMEVDKLDANGNAMTDANGNVLKERVPRFKITSNTTLSEIESIVKTLNSSGKVEDARTADALNNAMQKRIGEIGKQMAKVSAGQMSATDFDNIFKSSASKGIEQEAKVELADAGSKYRLVEKRLVESPNLPGYEKFKADVPSGLQGDTVADLSKYLKSSAAEIQQQITLEQERRKAKEKK